jgi:hypothetical protein
MKNSELAQHGDWIFTCSMKPLQFDKIDPKNPADYSYKYLLKDLNEEELFNFINDFFQTIEGSNHSFKHCGCHRISEKYAQWFISNQIWDLFDQFKSEEDAFVKYENLVKEKCLEAGIKFEGI